MQRLVVLLLLLLVSCSSSVVQADSNSDGTTTDSNSNLAPPETKEWNGNFARGLYPPGPCSKDLTPIGKMIFKKVVSTNTHDTDGKSCVEVGFTFTEPGGVAKAVNVSAEFNWECGVDNPVNSSELFKGKGCSGELVGTLSFSMDLKKMDDDHRDGDFMSFGDESAEDSGSNAADSFSDGGNHGDKCMLMTLEMFEEPLKPGFVMEWSVGEVVDGKEDDADNFDKNFFYAACDHKPDWPSTLPRWWDRNDLDHCHMDNTWEQFADGSAQAKWWDSATDQSNYYPMSMQTGGLGPLMRGHGEGPDGHPRFQVYLCSMDHNCAHGTSSTGHFCWVYDEMNQWFVPWGHHERELNSFMWNGMDGRNMYYSAGV